MKVLIGVLQGILFFFCLSPFAETSQLKVIYPHLYAVEHKGNVSFLFGSRHSKIDLSTLPDYVITAFYSRPVIAKEVVGSFIKGSATLAVQSSVHTRPPRPQPSPRAAAVLRARGIPEYLYRSPWICTFYYTWELGDGLYMDAAFEHLANEIDKPLVGLDEPSDMAAMEVSVQQQNEQCDIEEATRYITVENLKEKDDLALMRYFSGDLRRIEPCDEACNERTLLWLPKIENLHSAGGVFVLVGVAHLGGQYGLIEILQSRGYKVTQVTSSEHLDKILTRTKGRD